MITLRRSSDRGQTRTSWLQSYHTFSFADYYDPNFVGFGTLRVINEDYVQPGLGFGEHTHKDMEIITYVIEGQIEHRDSLGNTSILSRGEIQRMSAGTGVRHSEINPSSTQLLHFLQIWIFPNKTGLPPSYEQKSIPKIKNELIPMGSLLDGNGLVTIHQDVNLYVAYLNKNAVAQYVFEKNRSGWLQLIKGRITLNDKSLSAGDGAGITAEKTIGIHCLEDAEFLFFDMK